MPRRLACSDDQRGTPVALSYNGNAVPGFTGESLAAALFVGGARALGRSLKYHRPRSFFCLDGHCSGCLVRIDGVPNLRACQLGCRPGAQIDNQNAFPSAEVDLLAAVDRFFPRGMDHHSLMTSSKVLNAFANKVVRQLSGLGRLPDAIADAAPTPVTVAADVIVIGGGPAGLAAALAAARGGASVALVDEQARIGGSFRYDPRFGGAAADQRAAALAATSARVLSGHTVVGWFPEHEAAVAVSATTLTRLVAKAWVWATGSYAVNLALPENDRPGVFAARAVGRLLVEHAILAGERVCIVEEPGAADYAAALEAALLAAGGRATRVAAREVAGFRGRSWVKAVAVGATQKPLPCDAVAIAAVPSPASEGPRQHGCPVVLDPALGGFAVIADEHGATAVSGVFACGDVCGYLGPAAAEAAGTRCGEAAAAFAGGRA